MTERTGGSDVGGTETIAEPQPDGTYKITGFKFFTSATTSNATFLLARIVDPVTKKAVPVRIVSGEFIIILLTFECRVAEVCPYSTWT